jgi:hypothetical protein
VKPFKIVITKAGKSTYWYADFIGEEFDVVDIDTTFTNPSRFIVDYKGDKTTHAVSWCDCELVKEQ